MPPIRAVPESGRRIVHQRAGQRHFLLHAAGKCFAALMGMRLETEPTDQLACARLGDARVDPPEPGDEFEIFKRRELVVDHRLVG